MLCGASVLAAGISGSAYAAPAAAASNDSVQTIGEVVVQARKRSESVMKTPVVMQVVTAAQVQNMRLTDTQQLASVTPGLDIAPVSSAVGAVVNLRGLGNGDTAAALDQSVLLNIDGASLPSGLFYRGALFDVGQIEVLKGPQALFFGKSSSAGIIAIRSAEPTNYWDSSIATGYEFNAGELRTEGYISGPIAPDLTMRFAGYYTHIDGYYANPNPANTVHTSPNGEENAERFTLKYAPAGTGLRVEFKFTKSALFDLGNNVDQVQEKCAGSTPEVTAYQAYDNCKVDKYAGGLPNPLPYNPSLSYTPGNHAAFTTGTPLPIFGLGEDFAKIHTTATTLNIDYDLTPGLNLSSLTAYSHDVGADAATVSTGSLGLIYLGTENHVNDYSEEVRLTSSWKDSPVNFVAGALYDTTNGTTLTGLVLPAAMVFFNNGTGYRENTVSAFGQVLINPIKTVEIALGARYTEVNRYFTSLTASNNIFPSFLLGNGVPFLPTSAPIGGIATGIKEHNTSPEATVTWRPTSDLTAFVSYKKGYKGPGFSVNAQALTFHNIVLPGQAPPVTTVGGEHAEGVEGGIKAFLLERRLAVTASAYHYQYNNLQVGIVGPAFVATVFNGANARVQGIEGSVEYRPEYVPGLSLAGFANYNDSVYTAFPTAPCYGGQTQAEGCVPKTGSNPPVQGFQNLAGHRLPKAPLWVARFDLGYERDVLDKYTARADLNVNYSGSYNSTQEGNPLGVQSAYATLDLAVHFGPKDGHWSLAVLGRNLTNDIHVIDGTDTAATGYGPKLSDLSVAINRPRQVMLQLTLRPQF